MKDKEGSLVYFIRIYVRHWGLSLDPLETLLLEAAALSVIKGDLSTLSRALDMVVCFLSCLKLTFSYYLNPPSYPLTRTYSDTFLQDIARTPVIMLATESITQTIHPQDRVECRPICLDE